MCQEMPRLLQVVAEMMMPEAFAQPVFRQRQVPHTFANRANFYNVVTRGDKLNSACITGAGQSNHYPQHRFRQLSSIFLNRGTITRTPPTQLEAEARIVTS